MEGTVTISVHEHDKLRENSETLKSVRDLVSKDKDVIIRFDLKSQYQYAIVASSDEVKDYIEGVLSQEHELKAKLKDANNLIDESLSDNSILNKLIKNKATYSQVLLWGLAVSLIFNAIALKAYLAL